MSGLEVEVMENKLYQDLVVDLFTACFNTYSGIDEKELISQYISLLYDSFDICADIDDDLSSVLSMMILSLGEMPHLSIHDRASFVYGMSAANRDMEYVDLSQEEKYNRALSEFRCIDEHFDVYDIDKATLGYQALVFHELQPKFLEKK